MKKFFRLCIAIMLAGVLAANSYAGAAATAALAKKIEAWLDKERIIAIQEVTRLPSDIPYITNGPTFELGDERFNEGQLEIVAMHISWEADWDSVEVWEVLLESPQSHVRCIAAHCLLITYRIKHHAGRLTEFNCFVDPKSESGGAERAEFRKLLAAAKLKYGQNESRSEKAGQ